MERILTRNIHKEGSQTAAVYEAGGGYASLRRLPNEATLRWYLAAALVAERGLRAVNRVQPEGLVHLNEILAAAAEVLR